MKIKEIKKIIINIVFILSFSLPVFSFETITIEPIFENPIYITEATIESEKTTHISAQVTGRVTELNVKNGDQIEEGQILFKIDEKSALQNVLAHEAQIRSAQAQLEMAKKTMDRSEHLYNKSVLSQANYDMASTQFKVSKTQAEALIASGKAAINNAENFIINAPFSGIIYDLKIELGDMITLNSPALTLYAPNQIRATAEIPQSYQRDIDFTKNPLIEVSTTDRTNKIVSSEKIQIIPKIDPTSQTIQIRVLLKNNKMNFVPGMFARIHFFKKGPKIQKILVPELAIVKRDDFNACYVVDDIGKTHLRQLHLGPKQNDMIEILSGLNEGEKILLNPTTHNNLRE